MMDLQHARESSAKIFPRWKPVLGVLVMFGSLRIMLHWFSEATAWAGAAFILTSFIHLSPPRSNLSIAKVIFLAMAAAALLYGFSRLFG